MKVILIKDVARLGRKSEVKDVPDGHALNFLIPRKLAIIATAEELRKRNELVKKVDESNEYALQHFRDVCEALKGKNVTYAVEANAQGHLFKGINARDIAQHLNKELGVVLEENNIVLEHPIKSVGVHEVPLSFKNERGTCIVEVIKK